MHFVSRVPALYLNPSDAAGYIAPEQFLTNYRLLQERLDVENPERKLFLRKPLNIQSGQRHEAEDLGFAVLRNWVFRQAELQGLPD